LRLLDSRRLTGPNAVWEHPGAVIDVRFDDTDPELVIGAWQHAVRRLLDEVGWRDQSFCVRRFAGGASLAISAPVDALYTATEINDAAWDAARDMIEGGQRQLLLRVARQLREEVRDEERPRLQRLLRAAREHGVPALVDTESVSLGLGCRSCCWELAEVPHPDDVEWQRLGTIPVGLVTGTNGKTTSVRLLSAIGAAAGLVTGVSSTDWLSLGGEVLDRDDYAGPQGARTILRHPRCELAILETARGGLLRRGLAVDHADAALITNIAADHMGEFGVHDLEELADVKWTVTRALDADSCLALNADDPLLVARAPRSSARLIWFSPNPRNPVLAAHVAAGGSAVTVQRGRIMLLQGPLAEAVIAVKRVPITFGGAAAHNVANALGAAALAHGIGIATHHIAAGLVALSAHDNPGRANRFERDGVEVWLDFAHNPHGLQALVTMLQRLPARRRLLIIGQAGDRSDQDIRDLALAAGDGFDRVLIKRLEGHARGREPGEAAALLRQAFRDAGYGSKQLSIVASELGALRTALRWAHPGDQVLFLAHEDKQAATRQLQRWVAAGKKEQN
jgi:UDP-N-acetylmuramyl tripeptide synthase